MRIGGRLLSITFYSKISGETIAIGVIPNSFCFFVNNPFHFLWVIRDKMVLVVVLVDIFINAHIIVLDVPVSAFIN